MPELILRPMTDDEFVKYRARLIEDYANEHVKAGNWSAEEAPARSAADIDELLPEGASTTDMLVMMAEADDGESVGLVWLAVRRPMSPPGAAWVFDIEVDAGHRGKGYGRTLLEAAETLLREHGVKSVGLNVFGHNAVARRLYESAGYQVMSQQMTKQLG